MWLLREGSVGWSCGTIVLLVHTVCSGHLAQEAGGASALCDSPGVEMGRAMEGKEDRVRDVEESRAKGETVSAAGFASD